MKNPLLLFTCVLTLCSGGLAQTESPSGATTYRNQHPLLPITAQGVKSWGIDFNTLIGQTPNSWVINNNSGSPTTVGTQCFNLLGSGYVRVQANIKGNAPTNGYGATSIFDQPTIDSLYALVSQGFTPVCLIYVANPKGDFNDGTQTQNVANDTNFANAIVNAIKTNYTPTGTTTSWSPGHQGIIWEILNEPWDEQGGQSGITAPNYVQLLKTFFPIVRNSASNPYWDEYFVGFDTSTGQLQWTQDCMAAGVCGPLPSGLPNVPTGAYMLDGIALHPYMADSLNPTGSNLQTYGSTITSLYNLANQYQIMYNPENYGSGFSHSYFYGVPIVTSEFGYYYHQDGSVPADADLQSWIDNELDKDALDLRTFFSSFELTSGFLQNAVGLPVTTMFCVGNLDSNTLNGLELGNFGAYLYGTPFSMSTPESTYPPYLTPLGKSLNSITASLLKQATYSKRIFLPTSTGAPQIPSKDLNNHLINISPFNSTDNPQFDLLNTCLVFNNVPSGTSNGAALVDWENLEANFASGGTGLSWKSIFGIPEPAGVKLPVSSGTDTGAQLDLVYNGTSTTIPSTGVFSFPWTTNPGTNAAQPTDTSLITWNDPLIGTAGSIPNVSNFIYAPDHATMLGEINYILTHGNWSAASGATLYVRDDANSSLQWSGNPNCTDVLAPLNPAIRQFSPFNASYMGMGKNWTPSGSGWTTAQAATANTPVTGLSTFVTSSNYTQLPVFSDETGNAHILTFTLLFSNGQSIVQKCIAYTVPPNVIPSSAISGNGPATSYGPLSSQGTSIVFCTPGSGDLTVDVLNPTGKAFSGTIKAVVAGTTYSTAVSLAAGTLIQPYTFTAVVGQAGGGQGALATSQGTNAQAFLFDGTSTTPCSAISACICRLQDMSNASGVDTTSWPLAGIDGFPQWNGSTGWQFVAYIGGPGAPSSHSGEVDATVPANMTGAGVDLYSQYATNTLAYGGLTEQQAPWGFGCWVYSDGKGELLQSHLTDSSSSTPTQAGFTGGYIDGVWNNSLYLTSTAAPTGWHYIYIPFFPAAGISPVFPMKIVEPLQVFYPTSTTTQSYTLRFWGPTIFSPAS